MFKNVAKLRIIYRTRKFWREFITPNNNKSNYTVVCEEH